MKGPGLSRGGGGKGGGGRGGGGKGGEGRGGQDLCSAAEGWRRGTEERHNEGPLFVRRCHIVIPVYTDVTFCLPDAHYRPASGDRAAWPRHYLRED